MLILQPRPRHTQRDPRPKEVTMTDRSEATLDLNQLARLSAAVLTLGLILSVFGVAEADQSAVDEARQLLEAGKISEAEYLLQDAIEKDSSDEEAFLLLAKVYLYKQDHDKAIKYAERAVKINAEVSDYHLWLARAYLAKAMESNIFNAFRYARKGKGEYEKAVRLDSTNIDALFELCMYLVAAPWLAGGDNDRGIELAQAITERDSLYGAYAWAGIWEHDGKLDRAEDALQTAVKLDTSSAFYARYALGYFYERHERFEEALGVFKDILETKPDAVSAVYQVGKIHLLTGKNLEEAEACFKRYLEVEPPPNAPSWASAHWRLGLVYDLQGRLVLAAEEIRKAVELDPDNEQYRRSLKDIEKKLKASGGE